MIADAAGRMSFLPVAVCLEKAGDALVDHSAA